MVFIVAIAGGITLNFIHVDPVKALFWSAVINGVLAPFLLLAIFLIAIDRKIMRNQTSSMVSRFAVGLTALLMFGAAFGMFVF